MAHVKEPTRKLGDFGERLAATHLEANGYSILERNWRIREGEIDIIAERPGELVFVEVRSRRGCALGLPEESISARKARHVQAAVAAYLQNNPEAPENQRIDLIALELDTRGKLIRLNQIENAIEGYW